MKLFRSILSLLLVFSLTLGTLPVSVFAENGVEKKMEYAEVVEQEHYEEVASEYEDDDPYENWDGSFLVLEDLSFSDPYKTPYTEWETAMASVEVYYGEANLTYQWFVSETDAYEGTAIDDDAARSNQYPAPYPTEDEAVRYYYCEVGYIDQGSGEERVWRSRIDALMRTKAESFDVLLAPMSLWMGDLSTIYEHEDGALFSLYSNSARGTHAALGDEAVYSAYIKPEAHWFFGHDSLTYEWYWSEGDDYTDGEMIGSGVVTGLNEFENDYNGNNYYSYEYNMPDFREMNQYANIHVQLPTDETGDFTLTLVATNRYQGETCVRVASRRITVTESAEDLYEIDDDGYIRRYNGCSDELVIPASIHGQAVRGVTEIAPGGDGYYSPDFTCVRKITLPEGLEEISDYAFKRMISLEEVVFPSTLKTIGDDAFYGTRLQSVVFPSSLESVGYEAFSLCEAVSVTFADDAFPYIGGYAFYCCPNLEVVTFPANASGELYGSSSFASCPELAQVVNWESVAYGDPYDDFFDTPVMSHLGSGSLSDGSFYYDLNAESDGWLVSGFIKKPAALVIPGSFNELPVKGVKSDTFEGAGWLETLTVSEGVEWIGSEAFQGCAKLASVTLPSTLTDVNAGAFRNCGALTSVNFGGANITYVGSGAFENDYLLASEVALASGCIVKESAFKSCYSITAASLDGCRLETYSFDYCFNLETVTGAWSRKFRDADEGGLVPYDNFSFTKAYPVTRQHAAYEKQGTDYVRRTDRFMDGYIRDMVYYRVGDVAYNKGPATYDSPGTWRAEYWLDPLTEDIVVPGEAEIKQESGGKVTVKPEVGGDFFDFMLTEKWNVTFGSGIKAIWADGRGRLAEVTLPDTLEEFGSALFRADSYGLKGSPYLTAVELPASIKSILDYSFKNCTALRSLTFAEGFRCDTLPNYMCQGCYALRSIVIPEGVTTIGADAFQGTGLEDVTLPSTLKSIGFEAFYGTPVEHIAFPAGLETLGRYAFASTKLKEVDLSGCFSLRTIQLGAFANCKALESVKLSDLLTTIEESAFSKGGRTSAGIVPIRELVFGTGLVTIGANAFENAFVSPAGQEPTVVDLPDSVQTIGRMAFRLTELDDNEYDSGKNEYKLVNNFVLKDGHLPADLTGIGEDAFQYSAIDRVVLPENLTKVHDSAFRDAMYLTEVVFNEKLEELEYGAFRETKISPEDGVLTLPESLKKLGDYAFFNAVRDGNIQSVVLPAGIESVGRNAFGYVRMKLDAPKTDLTVTVLNPEGSLPALPEDGMANDNVNLLVRCYKDSATHVWAQTQKEKYPDRFDFRLISGDTLVRLLMRKPDGSTVGTNELDSVCWYDEADESGKVLSRTTTLEDYIEGHEYRAEIRTSDELRFDYFAPETLTLSVDPSRAENHNIEYELAAREPVAYTGRLDLSAASGQRLALSFRTGDYVREFVYDQAKYENTLGVAADGSFRLTTVKAPGELSLTAPLCRDLRIGDLQMRPVTGKDDGADVIDLGELALTKNDLQLSYRLRYMDVGTGKEVSPSFKGSFKLKNLTTGEELTAFTCGAFLDLGASCYASVSPGDVLELSFEPDGNSGYILSEPARITAVTGGAGLVNAEVSVKGPATLIVRSDEDVRLCVFDAAGERVTKQDGSGTLLAWNLIEGDYTVVGWRSDHIRSIESVDWFEENDAPEDCYFIETVSIAPHDYKEVRYDAPSGSISGQLFTDGNYTCFYVDRAHISADYTPLYINFAFEQEHYSGKEKSFSIRQDGVVSYFSAYQGCYAWLSDGTPLEASISGGGGHTRPTLTVTTTADRGTICLYAKPLGQELCLNRIVASGISLPTEYISLTMPNHSYQVTAPNPVSGTASGNLELQMLSDVPTKALVFVDGSLQSVSALRAAKVLGSFPLSYQFEAMGSASLHTLQVAVVKDGWQGETDEDWLALALGDEEEYEDTLIYLSDEYSVLYMPMPLPEPQTLQITANNGETSHWDGVGNVETITVDFTNGQTDALPFVITYWNLNEDGTMVKDYTFDYVLTMSNPESIEAGSVALWVYCGENTPRETVRIVPMEPGEKAGEFVGSLTFEGGTTTANDMPYAVAVDCDVATPEFDRSVYSEAALEKETKALEDYLDALAEAVASDDALYDVGVDMDELELLIQFLAPHATVVDETTGEERALTDEEVQDLRDVAVAMNGLSYEYNQDKQRLIEALESLASLNDGRVRTSEQVTVTEAQLQAAGAMQVPWDGGTLYILDTGDAFAVYDLTHGLSCTVSSQDGAQLLSDGGMLSLLGSDDPVGYVLENAPSGSMRLLADDGDDPLGDIADLNATRSKVVSVADAVNTLADLGLEEYNELEAAYKADKAAMEAALETAKTEHAAKIAKLEKKIKLYESLFNEKTLQEARAYYQANKGYWSPHQNQILYEKTVEQVGAWKKTLEALKAEDIVPSVRKGAALRPPLVTGKIRIFKSLKYVSSALQALFVSGGAAASFIKSAKATLQPLVNSKAGRAGLVTLGVVGLAAAVGLEGISIYEDYQELMGLREATKNRLNQLENDTAIFDKAYFGDPVYYLKDSVMQSHYGDRPHDTLVQLQFGDAINARLDFKMANQDLYRWRLQRFISGLAVSATSIGGILATLVSGGSAAIPSLIATIPGNYWSVTAQIMYRIKEDNLDEAYDEEYEHLVKPVGRHSSEEDDNGGRGSEGKDPRFPKHGTPTDPKIDPAGYAYEAVASNRVEGVTATVWYLGEDGAEHEWTEAAEYNEVNPQITGDDGCYSWYTPMGKWKVKLEKDGYLSADSTGDPAAVDGWLPVPPPQLDVNIAMVSTRSPEVDEVTVSDGELVLEFSQYMDAAELAAHPERITVTQNDDAVDVTAAFSDAEESPTDPDVQYGRRLVLARADGEPFKGDGIVVSVTAMQNYAGTAMKTDYQSASLSAGGETGSETGGNSGETGGNSGETGGSGGSGSSSGGEAVESTPANNPFTDVPEDAYYHDAVLWAVENGVAKGTGDGIFSPDASCTRSQMVTFLWRAAGMPEPNAANSAFGDVDGSAYYYKAVLWAAENGITQGTGDGRFDPDAVVNRAQSVTFLFRAIGGKTGGETRFTDVAPGEYYYDAVLWAVGNGVTQGTSTTTFSPMDDCLRAQIVTFLYRAYHK